MRATAAADFGDQLARSYLDPEPVTFDRFVRALGVGGTSHEDVLADLIRTDIQQRLARGLPLALADYSAAPGVGESEVLMDAAVQAFSGEPSGVQTLAYLAADLAGRKRRMMPCRMNHQTSLGISTTRWSLKNSAK